MKKKAPINIVVADDHRFFMDGLNMVIARDPRFLVVATCRNGDELVAAVQKYTPDIVITDLSMPVLSGIMAIKAIRKFNHHVPILVLTGFENDFLIIEAMEAGAIGYVNKSVAYEELYDAIESVYNRIPYYCSTTSNKLARLIGNSYFNPYSNEHTGMFNSLEKQIIKLICEDRKTEEIAQMLCIGIRTVENNRSRIIRKMNVRTSAGIAIYAVKNEMFYLKD